MPIVPAAPRPPRSAVRLPETPATPAAPPADDRPAQASAPFREILPVAGRSRWPDPDETARRQNPWRRGRSGRREHARRHFQAVWRDWSRHGCGPVELHLGKTARRPAEDWVLDHRAGGADPPWTGGAAQL